MKSVAWLAVLAVILHLPSTVAAQVLRSAPPSSGRTGGATQSGGTITTQSQPSASSSVTITTVPQAVAPAPKAPVVNAPTAPVLRFAPPVVHGGGVLINPKTPSSPAPVLKMEPARPPHHVKPPHRPFVYRHHPGIVIIDTPYYYSNTVITEMAPGVVREERRYTDTPPEPARTRSGGQLAPFDPTPQEVVERMLRLAAVKPGDLLYDLGAGDGRVAIAAAKKFAIKAVGFELDPGLVKLARENVRKQGVEHLVEIRQQDFLTADLSAPSVVTLYLSYDGNLTVRPRLMSQLKTGARVVSYTFDMAEWQPKATENYRDSGGNSHMIYLWEIGGPLAFSDVGR